MDAPLTCIMCRHWGFDPGTPDYSELTPGDAWSSYCMKGRWSLSGYHVNDRDYRKCLLTAVGCTDFEQVLG